VTNSGGPKFLVQSGVTGHVASSDWDFITFVNNLMTNPTLHRQMSAAARQYASMQSWDSVFEAVFRAYGQCCETPATYQNGVNTGVNPGVTPLLSSRVDGRGRS
jgi:hypothetical protein